MIKFDKDEFLKPQIYSTNDEYETRCNVTNEIVYDVKELQQKNQELKKQIKYLRSGEYYNQLRFENEMLQQVVDTNGVSSEVYNYIKCIHRNTELLEENQELKKQIEEKNKPQIFIDTQDMEERYAEGLYQDYLEEENKKYKNQQKEFINYMMNTIKNITYDETDDEEIKGYLIQRGNTFKEILSKYKEIMKKYEFNFDDYKSFCKRFNLKICKYDTLRFFKLVCTCE